MKRSVQLLGLIRREVTRFMKVPFQTVGTPILNATLYLMIFGIGVGDFIQAPIGGSYIEFLIPGLITMGVIRGAYDNTTSSIVSSKYVNELQDLRITPLSRLQILTGYVTSSVLRGILISVLTYLVGMVFTLFFLGRPLVIAHPLLALYFLIVGGATFSLLGLFVGIAAKSFEQMSIFGTFVLTPLVYLGGVFFSLDMLSPFWGKLAMLNPIYYFIEGMRYAFLGQNDTPLSLEMSFLLLFLIICVSIALKALKKGSQYVR